MRRWFFSSESFIAKTTNAGLSWEPKSAPNNNQTFSVFFPSDSIGYAVGWAGNIIKTNDYGENWKALSSPTTKVLNSVYFINDTIGYICGNNGALIKTTNGGNSWTNESITTNDLQCIKFVNDTLGIAVGYNTIFRYSKSGVSALKTQSYSESLKISPNPCSKILNLKVNKGNAIRIFDNTGKIVLSFNKTFNNSFEINVAKLKPGVYSIFVFSNDRIYSDRFIKK